MTPSRRVMASHIGRRRFLATLGGAAAAWPLAARAQQPAKLPTIGYLGSSTASAQRQWVAAFVQRLHDLGWIEGRTIASSRDRTPLEATVFRPFVRIIYERPSNVQLPLQLVQ